MRLLVSMPGSLLYRVIIRATPRQVVQKRLAGRWQGRRMRQPLFIGFSLGQDTLANYSGGICQDNGQMLRG